MQTLYEADNALEAHMLADVLKQEGLTAHILGEHLQGAAGGIAPTNLVRLVIEEADYAAARAVITRWESATPSPAATTSTPVKRSRAIVSFIAGLAVGIGACFAYYQAPAMVDGIDHNGDGVLDETWILSPSGAITRTEVDRNLDGKVDHIAQHNQLGDTVSATVDDDFNGVFETQLRYQRNNIFLATVDSNGDGFPDIRTHYKNGVGISTEYINPATGLPLRVEYFHLGTLVKADIDTNQDGVLDTRQWYTDLAEIASSETIQK
jgi:hypothetical protein